MIEQILQTADIFVAVKNCGGVYQYCNEKVAQALGLDSPHEIIGKTDYELCWKKHSELYIEGDRDVMRGKPFTNRVEPQTHLDGVKKILISKNFLLNKKDECIGVVGAYKDITGYFVRKKTFEIKSENDARFFLKLPAGDEYLTKREAQILRFILYGMSAKQIAGILRCSPRTVEVHIRNIKKKFQCNTIGDIIMFALQSGLTFSVLDLSL